VDLGFRYWVSHFQRVFYNCCSSDRWPGTKPIALTNNQTSS